MCILALKPAGVLAPSAEKLKNMFENNPDGGGVAWVQNGQIVIKKGIFDFEKFKKIVSNIPVESVAIIHCRIATSGGITEELCHPFPLTNDLKMMRTTSQKFEGFAVGHNGIFDGLKIAKDNSDTTAFIANVLYPLQTLKEKAGGSILDADLKPIVDVLVKGSKVAIVNEKNQFQLYGEFNMCDGIYYSNYSYSYSYITKTRYSGYGKSCSNCGSFPAETSEFRRNKTALYTAMKDDPALRKLVEDYYTAGYSFEDIVQFYVEGDL